MRSQTDGGGGSGWRRPCVLLAVATGFAALTFWLLLPLSSAPARDLYDPYSFARGHLSEADVPLNAWILAWVSHAVASGGLLDVFDANIFYPAPQALAYSEHMLGVAPLFAPLYLATGKLTLSLNLWIMATFLLCGLAMYWVALRWLGSHLAAAVAAVLYAFAPWRFYELAHVQLLSVQYLPLLLHALWVADTRPRAAVWLAIAGLAALQALSSYYLGYMAFATAAVFAGTCLLLRPGARLRRAGFVVSALLVAALVMVPVSLPYLEVQRSVIAKWSGSPEPWTVFARNVFPPGWPSAPQSWGLWLAVPGLALVGAGAGIASARYRTRAAALLLVAVVGLWLGLGPNGSVFGLRIGALDDLLSAGLPGWSAVRIVGRFRIVCWLALSLLAAIPFAAGLGWSERWRRPLGIAGLALIAGLLFSAARVEIRVRPSPETASDLAPYHWLARHGEGDPLLEWPLTGGLRDSHSMVLGTLHWLPLLNGYSGYQPPSFALVESLASALPEPAAARTLVDLNLVRWLAVHLDAGPGRRWDRLALAGAVPRFEGDAVRIYELPFEPGRPPGLADPDPQRSLLGTPRRRLRPEELRAELAPQRRELATPASAMLQLPLEVRNRSDTRWPAVAVETNGLVGVVWRARGQGGGPPRLLPGFTRLPADLAPGGVVAVTTSLRSPPPGRYELVPCLVQRGGAPPQCAEESGIELEVRPGRGA